MRLTFIPFLIIFQILVSCKHAEPEIILIPENYLGKIQIIYNQNGTPFKYKNAYGKEVLYTPKIGREIKYENNSRIYEIPESGILLTQFGSNDGIIDQKFFSINKLGKRTALEVFGRKKKNSDFSKIDKNKIGIFANGIVGVYGNQNIPFQEFVVSSYNQVDQVYTFEYGKEFDKKVHNAIGDF